MTSVFSYLSVFQGDQSWHSRICLEQFHGDFLQIHFCTIKELIPLVMWQASWITALSALLFKYFLALWRCFYRIAWTLCLLYISSLLLLNKELRWKATFFLYFLSLTLGKLFVTNIINWSSLNSLVSLNTTLVATRYLLFFNKSIIKSDYLLFSKPLLIHHFHLNVSQS